MEKKIIKRTLIIFLIILFIINSFVPNYTYAGVGSDIVNGVFNLLTFLGDSVISILQDVMIGGDIEDDDGNILIRYSPGMIFSDCIPSLKVNFITATENDYSFIYNTSPSNDFEMLDIIKREAKLYNDKYMFHDHVGDYMTLAMTFSSHYFQNEKGYKFDYEFGRITEETVFDLAGIEVVYIDGDGDGRWNQDENGNYKRSYQDELVLHVKEHQGRTLTLYDRKLCGRL